MIALVAGILRSIADGLESEGARPTPAPTVVHINHVTVEAGTPDDAVRGIRAAVAGKLTRGKADR